MSVKSGVRAGGGQWYNEDGPCTGPCICDRPRVVR
jgi:hypothetical protein